jgi:hypothetical protein
MTQNWPADIMQGQENEANYKRKRPRCVKVQLVLGILGVVALLCKRLSLGGFYYVNSST